MQKAVADSNLQKEQRKTTAHFWNLNEDPSLTAMIIHFAPEGTTAIGSVKANPNPPIILAGLRLIQRKLHLIHRCYTINN